MFCNCPRERDALRESGIGNGPLSYAVGRWGWSDSRLRWSVVCAAELCPPGIPCPPRKESSEAMPYCTECGHLFVQSEVVCPVCGCPPSALPVANPVVSDCLDRMDEVMTHEEVLDTIIQQYRIFATQKDAYDRVVSLDRGLKRPGGVRGVLRKIGRMYVVYLAIAFPMGGLWGLASYGWGPDRIPLLVVGLLIAAAAIAWGAARRGCRQKSREERDSALGSIRRFYESIPNRRLPFEYSNPYTLSMMYECALDRPVFTLKDAVNAYERERVDAQLASIDSQTRRLDDCFRSAAAAYLLIEATRPVEIIVTR